MKGIAFMVWSALFLYGILGGFFAELAGLFKLRHQARKDLPTWLKSPFYWIITMLMILAGGFMVIIYTKAGIILNPLVAVNIGASAPLILGTIIAQAPVLGKVN